MGERKIIRVRQYMSSNHDASFWDISDFENETRTTEAPVLELVSIDQIWLPGEDSSLTDVLTETDNQIYDIESDLRDAIVEEKIREINQLEESDNKIERKSTRLKNQVNYLATKK